MKTNTLLKLNDLSSSQKKALLMIMESIDKPLLVQQKLALFTAIKQSTGYTQEYLYGVLHLLDAIQDIIDPI